MDPFTWIARHFSDFIATSTVAVPAAVILLVLLASARVVWGLWSRGSKPVGKPTPQGRAKG